MGHEGGCIAPGSVSGDESCLHPHALPGRDPPGLVALEALVDYNWNWVPKKENFSSR